MAAEALRRKSQLILNNIAPVKVTYEELVKERLEAGKFPTTKTGIIKLTGMLFLVFALSVFLAQPKCSNTSDWYPYLLPAVLGLTLLVQLIFFVSFSIGITTKNPGRWVYSDLLAILILSIISLISSVVTLKDCTTETVIFQIPCPLGIAASAILLVSCISIFLMYRYNEEEQTLTPARTLNTPRPSEMYRGRRSVHA